MSRSGRRCCTCCSGQNALPAAITKREGLRRHDLYSSVQFLAKNGRRRWLLLARQAMTASIFKSSAIDRSESRPRWRGLATLLACPLPSLAAERCCAARSPRVTMGRVRRLASGVPKHIGPEVVIGCAGCPDEKPSKRAAFHPADNCSTSGMPEARIDRAQE